MRRKYDVEQHDCHSLSQSHKKIARNVRQEEHPHNEDADGNRGNKRRDGYP